jgi:hypothetical protein
MAGFVYALVEEGKQIIKIGMSPISNSDEWLRVYPIGTFYLWLRHTPTPVCDELLILETMRLWFINRIDIGPKYFEGDHSVFTWLLASLMLARETMQSSRA